MVPKRRKLKAKTKEEGFFKENKTIIGFEQPTVRIPYAMLTSSSTPRPVYKLRLGMIIGRGFPTPVRVLPVLRKNLQMGIEISLQEN